jgi:phosphate acyltransferase
MIKIALDAMGGDNAPQINIEGAVSAVQKNEGTYKVILTGPKNILEAELQKSGYTGDAIEIFDAPQVVAMDESPSSVLKTKPDSSLVTCVGLQKKGAAQASVSAGNSGAMMAACLMVLGRIGKISRPSIGCLMPCATGKVVLTDCGANMDEKATTLVDFAVCGSVFAEVALNKTEPTVGLLNVGEEEKKGPEIIQEAHQLLKAAPINFKGNVEGGDIVMGEVDVVVTSGFSGNVILKLMESFYHYHKGLFGDIDSDAGRKFNKEWDYDTYGAALLLGLQGTGLIAHGKASAKSIEVALDTAFQYAQSEISEKIAAKLES